MSKKINISVVGTGLMGLQHIKAISKSKKANLHSIVDISNKSKSLSKKYKIPLYPNVNELLNSKNLDAVIVATPNQLHEKHTVSFLKNKIPVLLEKPISDNIISAKKIISSANKNRKFKVEDTATVSLVFKSGALCTLNISDTIVAPWSYELTAGENPAYPITNQSSYMIGGTKGSLQFPNLKYWFYKNERSWWKKILVNENKNKKNDSTLVNQIDHFADVVFKKVRPKVNGNDGLISLKIFAAITKRAKFGEKIRL